MFYNSKRRHSFLDFISPNEFEKRYNKNVTQPKVLTEKKCLQLWVILVLSLIVLSFLVKLGNKYFPVPVNCCTSFSISIT